MKVILKALEDLNRAESLKVSNEKITAKMPGFKLEISRRHDDEDFTSGDVIVNIRINGKHVWANTFKTPSASRIDSHIWEVSKINKAWSEARNLANKMDRDNEVTANEIFTKLYNPKA